MARDLGRPSRRPRDRAAEQRPRPALVQRGPPRLGQLRVGRLAQQVVAEADATLPSHEHPAVERLHGRLRGTIDRQRRDLVVLELASGDRCELDEPPAGVAERAERAAHRSTDTL